MRILWTHASVEATRTIVETGITTRVDTEHHKRPLGTNWSQWVPVIDDQIVGQLVATARAQGLQLTGENSVLAGLTKKILESGLHAIPDCRCFYRPVSAETNEAGESSSGCQAVLRPVQRARFEVEPSSGGSRRVVPWARRRGGGKGGFLPM